MFIPHLGMVGERLFRPRGTLIPHLTVLNHEFPRRDFCYNMTYMEFAKKIDKLATNRWAKQESEIKTYSEAAVAQQKLELEESKHKTMHRNEVAAEKKVEAQQKTQIARAAAREARAAKWTMRQAERAEKQKQEDAQHAKEEQVEAEKLEAAAVLRKGKKHSLLK